MMPINISIVERNSVTFSKLKPLLNAAHGIDCSNVYLTGEEAVMGIPFRQPEIVLIDASLAPMSSIECVTRIKSRLPSLPIVILANDNESELALELLCGGADACINKSLSAEDMVKAIEKARTGELPLPVNVVRHLIRYIFLGRFGHEMEDLVEKFTRRELEVLDLLAQGCASEEIGRVLGCNAYVIKSDQRNILIKLHTNTRIHALNRFLRPASVAAKGPKSDGSFIEMSLSNT